MYLSTLCDASLGCLLMSAPQSMDVSLYFCAPSYSFTWASVLTCLSLRFLHHRIDLETTFAELLEEYNKMPISVLKNIIHILYSINYLLHFIHLV